MYQQKAVFLNKFFFFDGHKSKAFCILLQFLEPAVEEAQHLGLKPSKHVFKLCNHMLTFFKLSKFSLLRDQSPFGDSHPVTQRNSSVAVISRDCKVFQLPV